MARGRVIYQEKELRFKVRKLAAQISRDYRNQDIVLVGLLKGCVVFMTLLGMELERIKQRRIGVGDIYTEFLSIGSYGDDHTPGEIKLEMDMRRSVKGLHILLVEDVADTGLTLEWALTHLRKKEPLSVKVCVLIDKTDKHQVALTLDYVGDARTGLPFITGFGMDDCGAGRLACVIRAVPSTTKVSS